MGMNFCIDTNLCLKIFTFTCIRYKYLLSHSDAYFCTLRRYLVLIQRLVLDRVFVEAAKEHVYKHHTNLSH